jgi:hypothetical protein
MTNDSAAFDVKVFARAINRLKDDPVELESDDLEQLSIVGGKRLLEQARTFQDQVPLTVVPKHIEPIPDWEFTIDVEVQAEQLARTNPVALTDRHLRHLVIYDKQGAYRAAKARAQALIAERKKAAAGYIEKVTALQQTTRATTSAQSTGSAADPVSTDRKEYLQKHGHETVTVALLFEAMDVLMECMDVLYKSVDVEHRVKALETLTLDIEQLKQQEYAIKSFRARLEDLEKDDFKKRVSELELAILGVRSGVDA